MTIKTSPLASALALAASALLSGACNSAKAADLGGTCCGDLEERIAELEATTARKGNRKVSVVVYGQINKAITNLSGDLGSDTRVLGDNTASESYVGVRGEATIRPDIKAGYVIEIQEAFDNGIGGAGADSDDRTGIKTRQSYAYISSAQIGTVSIGLRSTATDLIYASVANTDAVVKPLTLQPFVGFEPLNGLKANIVRYDSPVFGGFTVSASWGEDDTKDIALKFSRTLDAFKVYAAAGYRETVDVDLALGAKDKVISLAASAMHIPTGMFVSAYYGQIDVGATLKPDAWQVMGGVERKFFDLGTTTLYAEYGDVSDFDGKLYGAGLVQQLGSDAIDAYLSYRKVEVGSGFDATAITGGLRVKF